MPLEPIINRYVLSNCIVASSVSAQVPLKLFIELTINMGKSVASSDPAQVPLELRNMKKESTTIESCIL